MGFGEVKITHSDLDDSDLEDETPLARITDTEGHVQYQDDIEHTTETYCADAFLMEMDSDDATTASEFDDDVPTLSELEDIAAELDRHELLDEDSNTIFKNIGKDVESLKRNPSNCTPERSYDDCSSYISVGSNRLPEFASIYYATPSLRDIIKHSVDPKSYMSIVDTSTTKLCSSEAFSHILDDVCVGVTSSNRLKSLIRNPPSILVEILGSGYDDNGNPATYLTLLDRLLDDLLSPTNAVDYRDPVQGNVLLFNLTKKYNNMAVTLLKDQEWLELGDRLLKMPPKPSLLVFQILYNQAMFEILPNGNVIQMCGSFVLNHFSDKIPPSTKSVTQRQSELHQDIESILFSSYSHCRDARITDKRYLLNALCENQPCLDSNISAQTPPNNEHTHFVTMNIFPMEYQLPLFKVTPQTNKTGTKGFHETNFNAQDSVEGYRTNSRDAFGESVCAKNFYRFFLELQKRHLKVNYAHIINRLCNVPSSKNESSLHCETYKVARALTTLFNTVFPEELFGSEVNWKTMSKIVGQFAYLKRNERIRLSYILGQMDLSSIEWIPEPVENSDDPRRIFGQFIIWFIRFWVLKVLNSFFVSKTVGADPNVHVYYRRHVWECVEERVISQGNFEKLERRFVAPTLRKSSLGTGIVYVRPKDGDGYRSIVSLGGRHKRQETVNSRLAALFEVLKFSTHADRAAVASVLRSLHSFLPALDCFKSSKGGGPYYIAKVDITKCFDKLNRDAILSLARNAISRYEKYRLIDVIAADVNSIAKGRWSRKMCQRVLPLDANSKELELFNGQLLKQGLPERTRLVFTDAQRRYTVKSKGELLNLLQEHLKATVVKSSHRYFTVKDGVPQGSVLSTLLCTLALNQFERELLCYNSKSSVLYRYVDDFLFASLEKSEAENFLACMTAGSSKYGVYINPAKTVTNFETEAVVPKPNVSNDTIPFLQWNIHVKTLDPIIGISDKRVLQGATGLTRDLPESTLLSHIRFKLLQKISSTLTKCIITYSWRSKKAFLQSIKHLAVDLRIRLRTMVKAADQKCLYYREHTRKPCLSLLLQRTSSTSVATPREIRAAFISGFR